MSYFHSETTMKKLLALILMTLMTTASFAQNPPAADAPAKPKAHVLTNEEFDKLAAKPEKLLIVDVRRPDEVTAIGGFPVYLSVQIGELENSTAWIPKERQIVVVSNHAGRGAKGADILAAKGFKVAGAIGAETYEQAGGKISKIVPPPPRVAATAAVATEK
jgi:rhodanese-related sulfurtransferase